MKGKGRLLRVGAHKVLTARFYSHALLGNSYSMDPRDLEFINELLEGEANLKEVNLLSPYYILYNSPDIHLYRGSANRVESLKREPE